MKHTYEKNPVLGELDSGHPLRNAPLASIAAAFRYLDQPKGRWHIIQPHWKIANCCFNDLGPTWTEFVEWRAG